MFQAIFKNSMHFSQVDYDVDISEFLVSFHSRSMSPGLVAGPTSTVHIHALIYWSRKILSLSKFP